MRVARVHVFWAKTMPDTNKAVQPHRMARGLKFRMLKVEELHFYEPKPKVLIRCKVAVQLICAFVLAYAKSSFFFMTQLILSFEKLSLGNSSS